MNLLCYHVNVRSKWTSLRSISVGILSGDSGIKSIVLLSSAPHTLGHDQLPFAMLTPISSSSTKTEKDFSVCHMASTYSRRKAQIPEVVLLCSMTNQK